MKQALYRWYDENHNLLYVGISRSLMSRIKDHQDNSHWVWSAKYVTVEWYETRFEVEVAEKVAIKYENPKHNITYQSHRKYDLAESWIQGQIKKKEQEIYLLKQKLAFTQECLERADLLAQVWKGLHELRTR